MNIVLFCGGRGNSNLIRALADYQDINLTLIVNAYDDGLSTGEIRKLIPGMLGPSDFRKNLSILLIPASEGHLVFSRILEHRLDLFKNGQKNIDILIESGAEKNNAKILIESDPILLNLLNLLPKKQKSIIVELTRNFLSEVAKNINKDNSIKLSEMNDFAFGNILLAGAYIKNGNSFSQANRYICAIFDISAKILNVSDENRYLVALTHSGEFVENEANIVSGNFEDKLSEIFLMEAPLNKEQRLEISKISSLREKKAYLDKLERVPKINKEVIDVLESADIILYGSGTQHSSLFPSYKVLGKNGFLPSTLKKSAKKFFIGNLDPDFDITGWSGDEILSAFRTYMKIDRTSELVDYIVVDIKSKISFPPSAEKPKILEGEIRGVRNYQAHDGKKLIELMFSTDTTFARSDGEVNFFLINSKDQVPENSNTRTDLDRENHTVRVNEFYDSDPSRKAIDHYNSWVSDEGSPRYLVIYACEGETDLNQLVSGINFMYLNKIAVLNGSRTQSRRQWLEATGRTYGEGFFRFNLSILATLLAVMACIVRRKQLLTDPLSRCLLIDKYALRTTEDSDFIYRGKTIPGLRTYLLSKGIDVSEFPIRYKVFRGYRAFLNPTRDAFFGFLEIMKLPK
jgi:2-phospho-L-lactate transferase/gluconeogenesis factor (CofD/UPF0052 family)